MNDLTFFIWTFLGTILIQIRMQSQLGKKMFDHAADSFLLNKDSSGNALRTVVNVINSSVIPGYSFFRKQMLSAVTGMQW